MPTFVCARRPTPVPSARSGVLPPQPASRILSLPQPTSRTTRLQGNPPARLACFQNPAPRRVAPAMRLHPGPCLTSPRSRRLRNPRRSHVRLTSPENTLCVGARTGTEADLLSRSSQPCPSYPSPPAPSRSLPAPLLSSQAHLILPFPGAAKSCKLSSSACPGHLKR